MVSTRPDISYAVGQLAMFLNCHGAQHHSAALHLLRYCKATKDLGITYSPSLSADSSSSSTLSHHHSLIIFGYSDADWASCVDTRRSTTGYVFFAAGGPISWKSKAQPTVALSSTEAEYMSLTAAAQEAMYLRSLQNVFAVQCDAPVLIYEDNKGAIAMSVNPVLHKTAKHIDLKHHFIREKIADGLIKLEYVSTDLMIADILTKALSKIIFLRLRSRLLGERV